MRILLVEDEPNLRTALQDTLQACGYTIDGCDNGEDALDRMCSAAYDLILLDRMLPKLDGITALQTARKNGVTTPVLILTALDAVGDRVTGLDAGADDYLAKPFATEELLARIRALSRRGESFLPKELSCGDITLCTDSRILTGPNDSTTLSQREYALLEILLRHTGTPLPRERLLLSVWGPDSDVEEGNLDNYIHLVRRRLRIVGSHLTLRTLRGVGYCLEEPSC